MSDPILTRASLLVRLRDSRDADAWSRFAEIYSPLLYRFATRNGLQASDASDLVQEVMGEVNKSIQTFDYDPKLGKFRSWLYRIAKRSLYRLNRRQKNQPVATGDSAMHRFLDDQVDQHNDIEAYWNREYRQHLLEWAADRIRNQFRPDHWQAFWLICIEDCSPQEVAKQLGISVGNVYVAKSRVLKRLTEKMREIDESI